MTFSAQDTLAHDVTFVARVRQAAILAATNVQAESPTATNHAARSALALQVLRSPELFGALMAQGVVTNVAISSGSTDSDIQFTVNSMWDAYAGTAP